MDTVLCEWSLKMAGVKEADHAYFYAAATVTDGSVGSTCGRRVGWGGSSRPPSLQSQPLHGIREGPRTFGSMPLRPKDRLGLSVPYGWWPAAPILKEIEAAGFRYVQVPSPPPSVLTVPREATRHAAALAEALGTAGLRLILHGPGSVRAGTRDGDTRWQA